MILGRYGDVEVGRVRGAKTARESAQVKTSRPSHVTRSRCLQMRTQTSISPLTSLIYVYPQHADSPRLLLRVWLGHSSFIFVRSPHFSTTVKQCTAPIYGSNTLAQPLHSQVIVADSSDEKGRTAAILKLPHVPDISSTFDLPLPVN